MGKGLLITNKKAGNADSIAVVRQRLNQFVELSECELCAETDLAAEVDAAVRKGCGIVIAAGGDGTVNAVVNALMSIPAANRPELAILPFGTANDFAGSLAIPIEPELAVALLFEQRKTNMDVIRAAASNYQRYYANVAAGGNSVRVSEQMTDEIKQAWGSFSYIRGAVDVLTDMQTYQISLQADDESFQLTAWAILIANGRTNAGGIPVAPVASPSDGWLDLIIIRDGTVMDMAEIISKTLLTSFLESEQVIFRQAKHVALTSEPAMRFALDGEAIKEQPVDFDLVPGAITVYVGPSV